MSDDGDELHFFDASPDADTLAALDADGDPWRWCDELPPDRSFCVVFHRDRHALTRDVTVCLKCGMRSDGEEVKS